MKRTDILGVGFDGFTLPEAVSKAEELLARGENAVVVTPNPEIVYLCVKDKTLRDVINRADMVLPDGIGIVWASRILRTPIAEKIAGIDFAEALMREMDKRSLSLFLLGAKPGVAALAAEKLAGKYPSMAVCGVRDGYFKDGGEAAEAVRASGADVVFVCLGAKKQELFMENYRRQMNAGLCIGLGGSLDVFAGCVKRAPEPWIRLGLEWLYRILKEPKRLSRALRLPLFVIMVFAARLGVKSAGGRYNNEE